MNCYVTKGGRKSMDPNKWRVALIAIAGWNTNTVLFYGVFPPNESEPCDLSVAHDLAMNKAQRRAMFAHIPAPFLLQNLTNEEDAR